MTDEEFEAEHARQVARIRRAMTGDLRLAAAMAAVAVAVAAAGGSRDVVAAAGVLAIINVASALMGSVTLERLDRLWSMYQRVKGRRP